MSYEPDGTSPTPSPEAPPDANVNAVAATQPAPDLGPAPVATATQAPAPAAAPPEKPGLWKRVLVGALTGLEMGGPAGALTGAVDPAAAAAAKQRATANADTRVAEGQAQVRMHNAQAADFLTEAYQRQKQIDEMPAQLKLKQIEAEGKQADVFLNHGVAPFAATADDSGQAATDAFNAAAGANGNTMPGVVAFHMGNYRLAFKVGDLAKNVGVFHDINVMNRVRGGPQFDSTDWFNPKSPSVPQAIKDKQTADLSHFYSPIGKSRDDNASLKAQYQGYIKSVQTWPDSDPEKAPTLDKLNAAVDVLDKAYQTVKTDKRDDIIAGAAARAKFYNEGKYVQAMDTTGTARYTTAKNAADNGWSPLAQGTSLLAKQGQMTEMEQWADTGVDKIKALPASLDSSTIALLTRAANTQDDRIIQNVITGLANKQLTPEQQDFTVWYVNMAERVMSMRNIASQGRGSDQARRALVAILPAAKSGNQQMMLKELAAVKNQMQILHASIGKVNLQPQYQPGGATAAPATTAKPGGKAAKWGVPIQ